MRILKDKGHKIIIHSTLSDEVLREYCVEHDVPFDYMQMQGRHNAAYWIQSIGRISAVQYEVMQRALGQRPSGRRRSSSN